MNRILSWIGLLALAGSGFSLEAQPLAGDMSPYYRLDTIPTPAGVTPQVGGLAFDPAGRLVVCFLRGRVYKYDPETGVWKLFAQGLDNPLGVIAPSTNELVIMQLPELTRLKDTDGDGVADEFDKITDAFGLSGNYCEFGYGPVVGPDGDYYISLNTASNGSGIQKERRGRYNPLGRPGRMFSCVAYRGWVMKVDPKTGKTTPFACGFRSPNGLGFDNQGRLFVSDNQGDWLGTSKLYDVQRGHFYGHASSLVWRPGWHVDPLKVPLKKLNAMRTRPMVQFPQGILANSPTQPLQDNTKGRFGPYAGEIFIGEMNHPLILRVMLEEVAGQLQGACVPFFDGHGLRKGNNRLVFDRQGRLWIGQLKRAYWIGDNGLQRLTWTGKTPMDVREMHLRRDGFRLVFTLPVDPSTATDPGVYHFRRYYYAYHRAYGSKQYGVKKVPVEGVDLAPDHRSVRLKLAALKPGYLYELRIGDLKSADGRPIIGKYIVYALNRLLDGTTGWPQFAGSAISSSKAAARENLAHENRTH